MSNIVAAEFEGFEAARAARRALRDEGFASSRTSMFYLNAGGQHARFPVGGDQYADPEAKGAGKGALTGAALGGVAGVALGIAATAVIGPIAVVGGLAAGAYVGSLAGAVRWLGRGRKRSQLNRPAGVVVAAFAPTPAECDHATSVLERHGPRAIEQADGTWQDGTWKDFDPVSIPKWRKPPESDRAEQRNRAGRA